MAKGAPVSELEEIKLEAFIACHGQSFRGEPASLIATAAWYSPQHSQGMREHPIAEARNALFELDHPMSVLRHLSLALVMMGSADEIDAEVGASIQVVAGKLVERLDKLIQERERICRLQPVETKPAPERKRPDLYVFLTPVADDGDSSVTHFAAAWSSAWRRFFWPRRFNTRKKPRPPSSGVTGGHEIWISRYKRELAISFPVPAKGSGPDNTDADRGHGVAREVCKSLEHAGNQTRVRIGPFSWRPLAGIASEIGIMGQHRFLRAGPIPSPDVVNGPF